MPSERSNRRSFLSLIFMTKSLSKKLLIKIYKLKMKIYGAHTRTHGKYEKYAAVLHLRNRKHVPCFYRVIGTRS